MDYPEPTAAHVSVILRMADSNSKASIRFFEKEMLRTEYPEGHENIAAAYEALCKRKGVRPKLDVLRKLKQEAEAAAAKEAADGDPVLVIELHHANEADRTHVDMTLSDGERLTTIQYVEWTDGSAIAAMLQDAFGEKIAVQSP